MSGSWGNHFLAAWRLLVMATVFEKQIQKDTSLTCSLLRTLGLSVSNAPATVIGSSRMATAIAGSERCMAGRQTGGTVCF